MVPGAGGFPAAERGSAAVEFMAILPYLLLTAILVWQLIMAAAVANAAEHAARNGGREAARGGEASDTAMQSLPSWLQRGAQVTGGGPGDRVEVCVGVPVLVPGVALEAMRICRDAEFASQAASPGGVL